MDPTYLFCHWIKKLKGKFAYSRFWPLMAISPKYPWKTGCTHMISHIFQFQNATSTKFGTRVAKYTIYIVLFSNFEKPSKTKVILYFHCNLESWIQIHITGLLVYISKFINGKYLDPIIDFGSSKFRTPISHSGTTIRIFLDVLSASSNFYTDSPLPWKPHVVFGISVGLWSSRFLWFVAVKFYWFISRKVKVIQLF